MKLGTSPLECAIRPALAGAVIGAPVGWCFAPVQGWVDFDWEPFAAAGLGAMVGFIAVGILFYFPRARHYSKMSNLGKLMFNREYDTFRTELERTVTTEPVVEALELAFRDRLLFRDAEMREGQLITKAIFRLHSLGAPPGSTTDILVVALDARRGDDFDWDYDGSIHHLAMLTQLAQGQVDAVALMGLYSYRYEWDYILYSTQFLAVLNESNCNLKTPFRTKSIPNNDENFFHRIVPMMWQHWQNMSVYPDLWKLEDEHGVNRTQLSQDSLRHLKLLALLFRSAEYLSKIGVRPNALDRKGQTPLEIMIKAHGPTLDGTSSEAVMSCLMSFMKMFAFEPLIREAGFWCLKPTRAEDAVLFATQLKIANPGEILTGRMLHSIKPDSVVVEAKVSTQCHNCGKTLTSTLMADSGGGFSSGRIACHCGVGYRLLSQGTSKDSYHQVCIVILIDGTVPARQFEASAFMVEPVSGVSPLLHAILTGLPKWKDKLLR